MMRERGHIVIEINMAAKEAEINKAEQIFR